MNSILSTPNSNSPNLLQQVQSQQVEQTSPAEVETKEAFQKFVAGTFYMQMLKALRSTQDQVQYLGGGQAEKVFRSQLDQQIAEDLASQEGSVISNRMYDSFRMHLEQSRQSENSSQIDLFA